MRLAETVEQPFPLMNAYLGIGFLYLRQGDLPQAVAWLAKGLEICQTTDVRLQLQFAAGALGYAYALSGRLAEAQPLLEQAVELTATRLSHVSTLGRPSRRSVSPGQPSGGGTPTR